MFGALDRPGPTKGIGNVRNISSMIGSASSAKPRQGGATVAMVVLMAVVVLGVTGGAVWVSSAMSPGQAAPAVYADAE